MRRKLQIRWLVVGLSLLMPVSVPGLPISAATFLIIPVYLLALRTIFTFERRSMLEPPEPAAARYPDITLRRAAAGYVFSAGFVGFEMSQIWKPL